MNQPLRVGAGCSFLVIWILSCVTLQWRFCPGACVRVPRLHHSLDSLWDTHKHHSSIYKILSYEMQFCACSEHKTCVRLCFFYWQQCFSQCSPVCGSPPGSRAVWIAAYVSDYFSESAMRSGVVLIGGGGFHHLGRPAEPIGALWVRLRMGLLCSCVSARKITKEKTTKMASAGVEGMDAAAQVLVSEFGRMTCSNNN